MLEEQPVLFRRSPSRRRLRPRFEHGADIDARTKGACGWTPLHIAAKERRRDAVKFLIENGAFLPPDMNDSRFNPPLHYCPGLEWAYEEMKRHRLLDLSSGETSYSSES